MASLSLRTSWTRRYPDADLANGLRAHLHPFYGEAGGQPPETLARRRAASPYESLRSLMEGLEWPRAFVPTRKTAHDHPNQQAPGWTDKLNGVTHDADHWYFTQQTRLWKVPVRHDLNGSLDGALSTHMPLAGYDHFGDVDFYQGHLYVAVEGHGAGKPGAVAMFDTQLRLRGSAALPPQNMSSPWCAVNPINGLLYSSAFNDEPDRIRLHVYHRALIANTSVGLVGLELEHLGSLELLDEAGHPLVLGGIQGAAFSRHGHLYLVVDTVMKSADDPAHRGIMGFDMVTGRRAVHTLVDYRPWRHFPGAGWVKIQELEGLTIWDNVDSLGAPGISGQLHLIMLDKEMFKDDDLYFKHYEVELAEDQGKI